MTHNQSDTAESIDGLLIERLAGVLMLTIDRPEAKNAINATVARGIAHALDQFEADEGLHVAVLTGAQGTFSAGMDLKAFTRGENIMTHRGLLGATPRPPAKPMIAAVEGWALAGGCELALACDLIVASTDAHFGIPEVKRGLIAAAGGLQRLPLALPYYVAMELALTGDPLPAPRAYELGMVNRLVAPGQARTTALELAARIMRNGPLAVRTSKRVLSSTTGWDDPQAWTQHEDTAHLIMTSHDAQEGARAFAEKRQPRWTGR